MSTVFILGWLATQLMSDFVIILSRFFTFFYFLYYVLLGFNSLIDSYFLEEYFEKEQVISKFYNEEGLDEKGEGLK